MRISDWSSDVCSSDLVLITGVGVVGCGNLLDVDAPSRVRADDLNNPVYATLLVKSAVGDFDCALASYITTTGMVVDEFKSVNKIGRASCRERVCQYV